MRGRKDRMDELFNPRTSSVKSSGVLYTPSTFARTALLHLQEALLAIHPHTSQRSDLVSFLCFVVLSSEGELSYERRTYQLHSGDCVFIDCRKAYSHSTSDNLWHLQWCHFYARPFQPCIRSIKSAAVAPCSTQMTSLLRLIIYKICGSMRNWGHCSPC